MHLLVLINVNTSLFSTRWSSATQLPRVVKAYCVSSHPKILIEQIGKLKSFFTQPKVSEVWNLEISTHL
jgi:hypothetical protein